MHFRSSWILCQEGLLEENEDESDYDQDDASMDSNDKAQKLHSPGSSKTINDKETGENVQTSKMKALIHSPTVFSPLCSPKPFPPNMSSPKPEVQCRNNEPITLLRLKSVRLTDSASATSLPVSPPMSNDYSTSSVDSDGEAIV